MTLSHLDRYGLLLSWSTLARDRVERFDPSRLRWYFLDGMIYECMLVAGQWQVAEIELRKTGNEWPFDGPARSE